METDAGKKAPKSRKARSKSDDASTSNIPEPPALSAPDSMASSLISSHRVLTNDAQVRPNIGIDSLMAASPWAAKGKYSALDTEATEHRTEKVKLERPKIEPLMAPKVGSDFTSLLENSPWSKPKPNLTPRVDTVGSDQGDVSLVLQPRTSQPLMDVIAPPYFGHSAPEIVGLGNSLVLEAATPDADLPGEAIQPQPILASLDTPSALTDEMLGDQFSGVSHGERADSHAYYDEGEMTQQPEACELQNSQDVQQTEFETPEVTSEANVETMIVIEAEPQEIAIPDDVNDVAVSTLPIDDFETGADTSYSHDQNQKVTETSETDLNDFVQQVDKVKNVLPLVPANYKIIPVESMVPGIWRLAQNGVQGIRSVGINLGRRILPLLHTHSKQEPVPIGFDE